MKTPLKVSLLLVATGLTSAAFWPCHTPEATAQAAKPAIAIVVPLQSPSLLLPKEVKGDIGGFITVAADTNCGEVQWYAIDAGLNLFPVHLLRDSKIVVVTSSKPGTYRLLAYGALGDKATPPAVCVVIVGQSPEPPTPEPKPEPKPIPVSGLQVLITTETADIGQMPKGQALILTAKEVRDYLNAKCSVGSDKKTKEWRIWDKDVSTANETPLWKELFARPRQSLPWIIIASGGKVIAEQPLPATVSETISLLKKYGG
jgi:hypothetical protein